MSADIPYAPTAPELGIMQADATTSSNSTSNANNSNSNTTADAIDAGERLSADDNSAGATVRRNTAYAFTGSALGSGSTANLKNHLGADASNKKEEEEEKHDDSVFECNICLDTAKDAVVSMCGHLFCWPCLHQWLETRPTRKLCPVCKAAIDKDKVIPLYGRNTTKQEDPRNKVPPRPAGQRIEPEPQGFQGFGFGDGFHMSFGIGAFPFGFFASSFNIGEPRPAAPAAANRNTTQYEDEQQLSKLFLYLAFLCIAWLLYA